MASRREFLQKGSLAVLGAPLTAGATLASIAGATAVLRAGPPPSGDTDLMTITYASASSAVRSTFKCESAAATGSLTLDSVVNFTPTRPRIPLAPWEECFVMKFSATTTTVLPPGQYKVTEKKLGTFNLTIGPVGQVDTKRYYEAVINRLPAGA